MRVQLLRLLRAGTTIRPVTRSNYVASVSRCKPFSTSGAVQQHKIDPEALDRLGKAIQENQALQEKLQDAASYMVSSGLLNIGKKPSMFDMLKILSKKEAREKLQALQLEAEKSGIDFAAPEIRDSLMGLTEKMLNEEKERRD